MFMYEGLDMCEFVKRCRRLSPLDMCVQRLVLGVAPLFLPDWSTQHGGNHVDQS